MTKETKKIASVLVIDDEEDVLKSLKDTLISENFSVHAALTGEKGIAMAEKVAPDVILLDLRLPDIDGYDVCQRLRKNQKTEKTPIIMISTRSKDTEKIVGLELGADDYLTKPYNAMELLARIRAVLRRTAMQPKDEGKPVGKIEQGTVSINTETRQVYVEGKLVQLTRKEFDLLTVFLVQPGKVFNRQFLLESVWGYEIDSLQGTVDSHIKTLRKKLGSAAKYIETVTGVGYRWAEAS